MRSYSLFFFATLSACLITHFSPTAAGAPVPKLRLDNSDQNKVQGKWKLTALKVGGAEFGQKVGVDLEMTIEFRGTGVLIQTRQARQEQRFSGIFEFVVVENVNRLRISNHQKLDELGRPAGKEKDITSGYVIDSDKMTWAMNQAGDGATTATNAARPDPNAIVFVFERVKDKD